MNKTYKIDNGEQNMNIGIRLSDIDIHSSNRSHNVAMDAAYITKLSADIRRNGLIHPITLVKAPDGANGKPYLAVAGAHRLEALKDLRGADGVLASTEYRLLDPSPNEKDILKISLSENRHRYSCGIIQEATYIKRLINEKRLRHAELRRLTGYPRQKLGAMMRLLERFDDLPLSWQRDLASPPNNHSDDSPHITITHWGEVAPKLPAGKFSPDLINILEKGRADKLSARQLAELIVTHDGPITDGRQGSRLIRPATMSTQDDAAVALTEPVDCGRICEILDEALAACAGDIKIAEPIRRLRKRIAQWCN